MSCVNSLAASAWQPLYVVYETPNWCFQPFYSSHFVLFFFFLIAHVNSGSHETLSLCLLYKLFLMLFSSFLLITTVQISCNDIWLGDISYDIYSACSLSFSFYMWKKNISFGTSVILVVLISFCMTITRLHCQVLLQCSVAGLFSDFWLMSDVLMRRNPVFLFVWHILLWAWWILLPSSLAQQSCSMCHFHLYQLFAFLSHSPM